MGLVPLSSGIEIPIIAYILNAKPELISISILDDRSATTSVIDPGVAFTLDVRCRDNNTAADILEITIVAYSAQSSQSAQDSLTDHYTFRWSSSDGFTGSQLDKAGCKAPSDRTGAEATWRFKARLDRSARASAWTIVAIVEDEAESSSRITSVTVTTFVSFGLSSQSITVSGQPGKVASTGLRASYACNTQIQIGVRCTTFVGKQDPAYKLAPNDFMVDDDPSPGVPESGRPILTLSSTRQVFIDRLEGAGQMDLYIFIKIPETFKDQDYEGNLIFDAR